MPEACPAVCTSLCTPTHGAKLVPSAPYEPPHQAPEDAACAKAITGTSNANIANTATTTVHLMSHSIGWDSRHSPSSDASKAPSTTLTNEDLTAMTFLRAEWVVRARTEPEGSRPRSSAGLDRRQSLQIE